LSFSRNIYGREDVKDMDKEQENRELEVKEESTQTGTEGETGKRPSGGSAFEGIYDMLPDISIRSLDRFILLCVIALVLVIVFGVLKANHVFG
jgi:hypothetical protein